jgi:hypothetical protein
MDEGAMRLKINLDQEDLMLGTACPYLRVGFDCGDSHRPLAAILNRLLLFCTSVESDNTASLCVRRRSCPQPNSHFAGVDDHVPSRPLACINLSP